MRRPPPPRADGTVPEVFQDRLLHTQAVRYLNGGRHVLHVTLEPVFAAAFVREAERRGVSRASLLIKIEQAKPPEQGLNSAVRCWLMEQAVAREGDFGAADAELTAKKGG